MKSRRERTLGSKRIFFFTSSSFFFSLTLLLGWLPSGALELPTAVVVDEDDADVALVALDVITGAVEADELITGAGLAPESPELLAFLPIPVPVDGLEVAVVVEVDASSDRPRGRLPLF